MPTSDVMPYLSTCKWATSAAIAEAVWEAEGRRGSLEGATWRVRNQLRRMTRDGIVECDETMHMKRWRLVG